MDPAQHTRQLAGSLRAVSGAAFAVLLFGQFPWVGVVVSGLLALALLRCAAVAGGTSLWWLRAAAACAMAAGALGTIDFLSERSWVLGVAVVTTAAGLMCAAAGFSPIAAWFGGAPRWQRVRGAATLAICTACFHAGSAMAGRDGGWPWFVAAAAVLGCLFYFSMAFSDLRQRVGAALDAPVDVVDQLHG